jgi:hypothetical protein
MARKKTKKNRNDTKDKKPTTLCTFCGNPATSVTMDDPFPRALWTGLSKDRPPKVPSHATCNNRSYEAILKHFFIALDSRFYQDTIRHFKEKKGKGDLLTFVKMWAEIGGNFYLYLNEQVTAKFKKMFMGIRRHLMGDSWFFVPEDHFLLFKIDKREDIYEARPLPLVVGAANPAHPLLRDYAEAMNEPMDHKFRDFNYGVLIDDEDGMMLGLRYEREEFAELGNRLHLVCFIPKEPATAAEPATTEYTR